MHGWELLTLLASYRMCNTTEVNSPPDTYLKWKGFPKPSHW